MALTSATKLIGTEIPPATAAAARRSFGASLPVQEKREAAARASGSVGSSRQVAITLSALPVRAAVSYAIMPPMLAPNTMNGRPSSSASTKSQRRSIQSG